MKNKMTVITRCSVGALGLAFVCLTGTKASAQNPRLYPALKSQHRGEENTKPASATALSAQDKRFINEAAKGGMMEVAGGKMAAKNAKNAEVKKFGNRMVKDHSMANSELMSLASAKGVQVPAAKSAEKWKSDKEYMDMMVKDHEKDISEFQAEAKNGSDADVKKFANKTARVIEKHLQVAKEIQGKLK